jgi:hypothetical protein
MTGARLLLCEEPLGPNPELTAVDDESSAITLAEFAVDGLCRYSFSWNRGEAEVEVRAVRLLDALGEHVPVKPNICVAGWRHEVPSGLRVRHRHVVSTLQRRGWQVRAESGIGLAMRAIDGGELPQAVELLRSTGHTGWFLAFGSWPSASALAQSPFRNTLASFCWTHRLAPSRPFLQGLRDAGGAVAYLVADDVHLARAILITPTAMGARLSSLVDNVRSAQ